MSALREIFARFGIEFDTTALERGIGAVNNAVGTIRFAVREITGNDTVGAVLNFANGFEQVAGALEDTSNSLGVTTAELQSLQFAATAAGVEAGALTGALATLARNASHGGAEASAAFAALGVRARDASGEVRSLPDLMEDLAQGFDRVEDPARRIALATQLFGGAGRQLAPVLRSGAGGVAALRREFAALGGGLSPESIAAAGAYGDALDRFRVVADGARAQLAVQLLPALTQLVTWVQRGTAAARPFLAGTNALRVAMVGLAGVLASQLYPSLLRIAVVGAPWLLFFLLIEDLFTLFTGGDSLIGRVIDQMLGAGTAADGVRLLRDVWREVFEVIQLTVGYLLRHANSPVMRFLGGLTSFANPMRVFGELSRQGAILAHLATGNRAAAAGLYNNSTITQTGRAAAGTVESAFALAAPPVARNGGREGPRYSDTAGLTGAALADARFRNAMLARMQPPGSPPPPTIAAASARGATVHQRTVTIAPGAIQVHGGNQDPRAIAREVRRELDARERAANDHAHPHPPDDGGT